MSQPPYQPNSGDPGSEGGYQPPAAPGSYPPPGQGAYPPGTYPQPSQPAYQPPSSPASYPPPPSGPGSYPPPDQGAYPPGSYGQPSYPPPAEQGAYPPPADQGAYPPPPGGAYPAPGGAYPAPGSGAPQYGMAPPPKKKSSALKIVLIVVGVVALLCVAGGVITFFAAKDKVEQVVDATKISVVEPETLGGRPKASDPTLQASVSGLDGVMSNIPGATGSVGAIYGDLTKQDIVMVAAASSINGSAQDRFDEFSSGMGGAGGIKIDNLTDTDPGPLGGIAKCGDTDTSGVPMAVCVWSDNGSVGMLAMMFKKKADLEKEFITLRGEVEQKS